jgi:hypothetical protein
MSEREYVISLHDYNELDSFYQDMETSGGNLYIPNRAVPVHNRRPISRNTHYMLTDQEAEAVRNDPRVLAVELSLKEQGVELTPAWSQTSSYWNKSSSLSNTNVYPNWALLRCTNGSQITNWGTNGTTDQAATVKTTASGRGVDVVIVDGHIDPAHPEFSTTVDGSGPSRVVQYNWFALNPVVNGTAAGSYSYAPYVDPTYPDSNGDGISDRSSDNDHGCHVAGTVAGNTQGWARDATIYNISPFVSSPSPVVSNFMDYVRVWHNTKPVDPNTGIKRPTITNHSYVYLDTIDITTITRVVYRGVFNSGPFTANQLQAFGIYNTRGFASVLVRNTAQEVDLQDAMADGVIVVGAAGNQRNKISLPSADPANDYNNFLTGGLFVRYYNRGSSTAVTNAITVGAASATVIETKATYSNCGPRIDIFAPGTYITSSVNSSNGVFVTDKRNVAYSQTKYSGTSMAAPQVAGILACLAETWPNMTQAQALEYIIARSKSGQLTATSGGTADFTDLQGAANRYLAYFKERPENGQVYPKVNQGNRQSTGMLYPRAKIYRYGR